MAEDRPGRPDPPADAGADNDVLGKIDQLLSRHRPKPPAAEAIPLLTDAPRDEPGTPEDGIPVLTDVVTGTGQPAGNAPATSRPGSVSSTVILRRMAVALEAEQARLLAQIGDDPVQARLLERLVAELKRALPAAVRAALTERPTDPASSGEEGRL